MHGEPDEGAQETVHVSVFGINGELLVERDVAPRKDALVGDRVYLLKEDLARCLGHYTASFRLLLGAEELADRHLDDPSKELALTAIFELGVSSYHAMFMAARGGFGPELRKRLSLLEPEARQSFLREGDDYEEDTPLLIAARKGHLAVLQVVLASAREEGLLQEALLDRNLDKNTALHLAAERGDAAMVRELLAHAADTSLLLARGDFSGWQSSLDVAAERGHAAVARLLLAACGKEEAVSLLLRSEGPPSSPLHAATAQGNAELAQLLLEAATAHGVLEELATRRDEAGFGTLPHGTALARAVQYGHTQVVRMLLQATNGRECQRSQLFEGCGRGSALHLALDRGHEAVASALLADGGSRRALLLEPDALGVQPLALAEQSPDGARLAPLLLRCAEADGLGPAELLAGGA